MQQKQSQEHISALNNICTSYFMHSQINKQSIDSKKKGFGQYHGSCDQCSPWSIWSIQSINHVAFCPVFANKKVCAGNNKKPIFLQNHQRPKHWVLGDQLKNLKGPLEKTKES